MITGNRVLTSNTIIWNPAGIGFSGGNPQIIFQSSTGWIKLNRDLVRELDKNFSRFDTGQYSKLNFGLIQLDESPSDFTVLLGSSKAFAELKMPSGSTLESKKRHSENRHDAYDFASKNATLFVDNLASKLMNAPTGGKNYCWHHWSDCIGYRGKTLSQGRGEPRLEVQVTTFEPTHAFAMYTDETSSPIIQIDLGRRTS